MRTIYCDGACVPNPGASAAAAILLSAAPTETPEATKVRRLGHGTNQSAELTALIMALDLAEGLAEPATIRSDSQYSVNGATSWLARWKRNGWRNAKKEPVANKQLWLEIDARLDRLARLKRSPQILWVKGHNIDRWNNLVDSLANSAVTSRTRTTPETIERPAERPDPKIRAALAEFVAKLETRLADPTSYPADWTGDEWRRQALTAMRTAAQDSDPLSAAFYAFFVAAPASLR